MAGDVLLGGACVEVDQLKALVCVARTGSFTRAAALLYVTQPAVSRRIDQLEHAVGVRLVDRTTRRVELTAAGAVLTGRAEVLLAELARAEIDCRRAAAGMLPAPPPAPAGVRLPVQRPAAQPADRAERGPGIDAGWS